MTADLLLSFVISAAILGLALIIHGWFSMRRWLSKEEIRLKCLEIADGDIEKAKRYEDHVLSDSLDLNVEFYPTGSIKSVKANTRKGLNTLDKLLDERDRLENIFPKTGTAA